jgi:signal transduction histidine kinase
MSTPEIMFRLFTMKVLPVLHRLEHVLGTILLSAAIIIALLLLIDEIAQRGKAKRGQQKLPATIPPPKVSPPVITKTPEPAPIVPEKEPVVEKPVTVEKILTVTEPVIEAEQAVSFSLKDEATKLFSHFKKNCQEKGLSFSIELDERIPQLIIGKKQWLHDLLYQLFNIALEQTYAGSISLKIKMVKANDKNATVQFLITDTGDGLPPSLLKAVQEKDFLLQFDDALLQSILVKLRVVKQTVEDAGGRLTVATKAGAGSTVGAMIEFGI